MKKYWIVAMVAVLLLAAIAFAQQSPKTPTQTQGRFSLIQAEIPGIAPPGNREPGLFVIDSQTGQVWKYSPPSVYSNDKGENLGTPDVFLPVAFQKKAYLSKDQVDRPQ